MDGLFVAEVEFHEQLAVHLPRWCEGSRPVCPPGAGRLQNSSGLKPEKPKLLGRV